MMIKKVSGYVMLVWCIAFCSVSVCSENLKVTGIKAFYRNGQTFVTWKDVAEGEEGAKYRYSLYRSDKPITQENRDEAECVIQGILNNSCKLMGSDLTFKDRLDPKWPTCQLTEESDPLPLWSGVAVHTVTKEGKGYYAVVATDSKLNPVTQVVPGASAMTEPVEEKPAPVQPIRQVKAEALLRSKGGKISGTKKGLPLYIQLHASCSSKPKMRGHGFYFLYFAPEKEMGWRAGQPGVFAVGESGGEHPKLILSPRDTMNTPGGRRGRENLWFGLLCRPNWADHPEPRAYPFAEKRLEWIIKWVVEKYSVDTNRICMGGQSMGAWGTFTIGLKRPKIFAGLYPTGPKCHQWMLAGIGKLGKVYLTGATREKKIKSKYLRQLGGKPPMMPDGKTEFFDYLDLVTFVENTHRDLPFACFIGGRHGGKPWAGYAKWGNMVAMVKALTENHHGFGFGWDNGGHGSARKQFKLLKKYYPPERFALDLSYPAFGNSSIDDDTGPDGPEEGYVNVGFIWTDPVDEADRWECTISNAEAKEDMKTDVTPRRCQNFKIKPGEELTWNTSTGGSGTVKADEFGLVTVPKVGIQHGEKVTLKILKKE